MIIAETKIEWMPFIACALSVASFFLFRLLLLTLVKRDQNQSVSRSIAVRVTRLPSLFWCVIAGLRVGTEFWETNPHVSKLINLMITIMTVVSLTMVISRGLKELLSHSLERIQSPLSHNGLIRGVISGTSFLIGSLIFLSQLGIHVEPLLAALGVSGLAIGLAIQDTLSNFFAGIGLLLDRSVEIGDCIKLENGMEGRVLDIGWRTTRFQVNANDLMVVPNTKLAQSIAIRKDVIKSFKMKKPE